MTSQSMTSYPEVVNEINTLRMLVDMPKLSIARFGDGEFNLVRGGNCVSQVYDPNIRDELRKILRSNFSNCLVGIPNPDPKGPKWEHWWSKQFKNYKNWLHPDKVYYSSFITRPDSAPWIAKEDYFDLMEQLWKDRDVTVVRGTLKSLYAEHPSLESAASVVEIMAPPQHAYQYIRETYDKIVAAGTDRTVLLFLGPTATCLAHRLSKVGARALDLGHVGSFWRCHKSEKFQSKINGWRHRHEARSGK